VAEELGSSSGGYKAKIRSLFVNLKDKNNPSLREGVISGDIAGAKFAKMTSEV
jgi:transcription elongation factor S-II